MSRGTEILVAIAAVAVIAIGLLYVSQHASWGCINVPFMPKSCGVITH